MSAKTTVTIQTEAVFLTTLSADIKGHVISPDEGCCVEMVTRLGCRSVNLSPDDIERMRKFFQELCYDLNSSSKVKFR